MKKSFAKMNHRILLFIAFFISANRTIAQTDLAIGQWKSHLPFNAGLYVTQSDSEVFYATKLALLSIDKEDMAMRRMTKVEGLSNVGISIIKYNRFGNILMIVYDGGTIDLVKEDEILTVFDIPTSNIIVGEKEVFDIFIFNDSIAFLGANYGITKFNMKTGQSPFTTKMPVPANAIIVKDNVIFAGTSEGIYTADLETNINVDDFNNWDWLGPVEGFPADYHTEAMALFDDDIFLEVNDTLFRYDGSVLEFIHYEEFESASTRVTYLSSEGKKLMAGFRPRANKAGKVLCFDENLEITELPTNCVSRPRYGIEDEKGRIWLAEAEEVRRDFRMIDASGNCKRITVNSPYTSDIREIIVQNGEVWIASGGVDQSSRALENSDGFFSLIEGQWSVYNKFLTPEIAEHGLIDFYVIRMHPENGTIYAGTYWDGLVEYDRENFVIYNDTNSTMTNANLDSQRTRVSGLAFDSDNNLWVSNNLGDRPLSVLKNDGTWQSFDLECNTENDFMDITIDFFGYKWIVLATDVNKGIFVFDEGDLDVAGDDNCHVITSSNSNLPSNRVNVVEVDLDGSVWVGTEQGAIVFECDVINTDCPGSLRIGELDEFGAHLLEDQNIRTIAVDGANRKWFGTLTGIFVMSPSGEEQVAGFNVDNSPLFDNHIIDIAFNHETGEAYIGTAKGLQVLRAEATVGGPVNSLDVLVFPNPVRPDYTGLIAIKGLAQDADVKITDINGQLVYETTALGGQAIWDGRDYNGRKANSGVYLVFSTNNSTQNPEAVVAKILFMN